MTGPILHSYSFHNYPLGDFLDYAEHGRWAGVELASCHFGKSAVKAVQAVQKRGLKVQTMGFYADVATTSVPNRQRATSDLIEQVRLCAELGVPRLNGFAGWMLAPDVAWGESLRHGSRLASDEQRGWFNEAFTAVGKEAEARQVTVFVEVHPNTLHDTTTAAGDLIAAVNSNAIGITLDPGNSAALDPRDAEPKNLVVRGQPLYFHFKNYRQVDNRTTFDVDADQGQLDLRGWLHALPPGTPVCIEYPGDGDPYPRLDAARRYYDEIIRRS